MAVKQRKSAAKGKNNKNKSKSTEQSATSGKDNNDTNSSSSDQPAGSISNLLIMVSFVAVAVAGMYVSNNRNLPFLPSGYNLQDSLTSTPLESPPLVEETVYDEKWGNFYGIASITNAFRVLKVTPHDPSAFTQGLQVHKDQMIESTGGYGESLIRIYDPDTGDVSKETNKLPSNYFGEGVTYFQDEHGNERLVWLTWRERTAFVYDTDLQFVNSFEFETHKDEGWGITFDPVEKVFYVTDGSEYLQVWDLSFKEIRRVKVSYQTDPNAERRIEVPQINELEWDVTDGTVLANVWYQNVILRIDPRSGNVLQIYDLTELYVNRHETADCMNGIAHQGGNRWWLTGKYWPYMYLVEFLE